MSSISGLSSSSISAILSQGMQSKSPAEKFKELDTDSNGGLDTVELSTMAKELSKMTGKTLNVDEMLTTYDANQDGKLSQDETDTMMQQQIGPPPGAGGGRSQQAIKAYQANSGEEDQLPALLKMLEKTQSASTTSQSSSTTGSANDDQLSALLAMVSQNTEASSTTPARPNPEEMFKKIDSDSNASVNKTELDVWAKDFTSMTGQTVDTAKAITTYDTDGDGALSKTEMDTMMKGLHDPSGTKDTQGNTNNDQNSLLRQLLEQYIANQSTDTSGGVASYV